MLLVRLGAILPLALHPVCTALATENWPDFRGPTQDGCTTVAGLPTAWSETEDVVWKTAVPGQGWSSPVIWGDRVWMSTATPDGHELFALAIDSQRLYVHFGTYRELAVNRLDDGFVASAAVSGTSLYLRTRTHLYRIENRRNRRDGP